MDRTYEEEIETRVEILRPFLETMTIEELYYMIAELDLARDN